MYKEKDIRKEETITDGKVGQKTLNIMSLTDRNVEKGTQPLKNMKSTNRKSRIREYERRYPILNIMMRIGKKQNIKMRKVNKKYNAKKFWQRH